MRHRAPDEPIAAGSRGATAPGDQAPLRETSDVCWPARPRTPTLDSWEKTGMKLATIRRGDGTLTTAAILGDEAVDLCALDAGIPHEMTELLAHLDQDPVRVRAAVESGQGRLPLGSVTL